MREQISELTKNINGETSRTYAAALKSYSLPAYTQIHRLAPTLPSLGTAAGAPVQDQCMEADSSRHSRTTDDLKEAHK